VHVSSSNLVLHEGKIGLKQSNSQAKALPSVGVQLDLLDLFSVGEGGEQFDFDWLFVFFAASPSISSMVTDGHTNSFQPNGSGYNASLAFDGASEI